MVSALCSITAASSEQHSLKCLWLFCLWPEMVLHNSHSSQGLPNAFGAAESKLPQIKAVVGGLH